MIWGKIIGSLLGYAILGGFGLLIGLFVGHRFDLNLTQYNFFMGSSNLNTLKDHFFEALFACMGHVAKADGRVSEPEIQAARAIMQSMQLSARKTQQAIDFFTQGKGPDFDMRSLLQKLKQECRGNRSLLRMFMQLQFQAAYASGTLHPAQEKELLTMSQYLGFSAFEYQQCQAMFRAQYEFAEQQYHYYQQSQSHSGQRHSFEQVQKNDVEQAYKILNVTRSATQDQVKKAYRRLMNEYHPDKLAAKGLPNEMMKAATEKTTQIQLAYEMIKKNKGWK
jgi:DnaJ like chaperone protein